MRSFVQKYRTAYIGIARTTTLSIKLTDTSGVRFARSHVRKYLTLEGKIRSDSRYRFSTTATTCSAARDVRRDAIIVKPNTVTPALETPPRYTRKFPVGTPKASLPTHPSSETALRAYQLFATPASRLPLHRQCPRHS